MKVDCSQARRKMALRARGFRDVAYRPLEQAAEEAAAEARATTAWKDKSGATRQTIKPSNGPGLNRSTVRARGASVFLEAGTGRYGLRGRDYVITPKSGRFLSFMAGGHRVFASHVIHPGIHATHFMHDAAETIRPRFVEACVRAAHNAIARP